MSTSYVTDEHRKLIGVPGPELTAPHPLGPDELRRFVQGVMEGNPVHWDPAAARDSRYGEVVATPLFPMHTPTRPAPGGPDPLDRLGEDPDWDGIDRSAAFGGLPAIDLPLKRILNGGTEAEFFQLAKLGDVITARSEYTDITEREGRSGAMVLVKVQTTYTNQDGDKLLVSTMTVIMR
jgi:acyl dehydratase